MFKQEGGGKTNSHVTGRAEGHPPHTSRLILSLFISFAQVCVLIPVSPEQEESEKSEKSQPTAGANQRRRGGAMAMTKESWQRHVAGSS